MTTGTYPDAVLKGFSEGKTNADRLAQLDANLRTGLESDRPRQHREPITLRTNFGSFRVVDEVLAFDAVKGIILARVIDDGHTSYESFSLTELEALDADRKFIDVKKVVRSMAGESNE